MDTSAAVQDATAIPQGQRAAVMNLVLQLAFKISLIIFMVGNLAAMGLQLRLADAVAPLRNPRFVFRTILAGFLFSPLLAYLISIAVPMERPYAIGLLLLGLAPAAPFLPLAVKRAHGDLAASAGVMLLASPGNHPDYALRCSPDRAGHVSGRMEHRQATAFPGFASAGVGNAGEIPMAGDGRLAV